MTIRSGISFHSRIEVQASAARAAAARRLAAEQADAVAACKGGASDETIELLLLLQESVLVFDETHTLTTALADEEQRLGQAKAGETAGERRRPRQRQRPRVVAAKTAAFLVFLVAATFLVEILDPAPMGVLAVGIDTPSPWP